MKLPEIEGILVNIMKSYFFSTGLLLLAACNMSGKPEFLAKNLNDSAVAITNRYHDTAKFREAIRLLDQAIELDSTKFEFYRNRYFFESSLGESKLALQTIGHLLRFRPDSADLHFQAGILLGNFISYESCLLHLRD